VKNTQGILLFAVMFAVVAPAFADNVPGHSKGGSNYVTFSEGFAAEQNSHGNSAQCNFLWGPMKESGLSASSVAGAVSAGFWKGENDSVSGGGNSLKLVDFTGNQGASSDKDKGKGHGKHHGEDGEGNGSGVGISVPSPVISVAEPASQSLVLFGLAGLGMIFYRRKSLTNAI
jgi:hypothetical protein